VIPARHVHGFSGRASAKRVSLEMHGPKVSGEPLVSGVVSVSVEICHWVRASALLSQLH